MNIENDLKLSNKAKFEREIAIDGRKNKVRMNKCQSTGPRVKIMPSRCKKSSPNSFLPFPQTHEWSGLRFPSCNSIRRTNVLNGAHGSSHCRGQ